MERMKDFVFIDSNGIPYRVRPLGLSNTPWLFYWSLDHKWVSQRPIYTIGELLISESHALPMKEARLYDPASWDDAPDYSQTSIAAS